ncbi:hypothetical protein SAMN05443245_6377 [Paraburkholderia fungorum]|uniref:Uncharacterized protein n=1 Tax=Paraburkholderia fungorum TaxID=134537 RepID=A0A1H1JGX1_9BURK|nr:hypothetical protein SAMN05443245_6377 [Paraburkholderia fungorum]
MPCLKQRERVAYLGRSIQLCRYVVTLIDQVVSPTLLLLRGRVGTGRALRAAPVGFVVRHSPALSENPCFFRCFQTRARFTHA